MNRKLSWEKWISPLEKNLDKVDPELVEHIKHRIKSGEDNDPDSHFYGDVHLRKELYGEDDDDNKVMFGGFNLKNKNYRILVNQFGVHVATEQTLPNAAFNFWIGHTNFNIGKKELKIINRCPGIESLDLYSRYRFRVGIGKQFKASEVFSELETLLQANGKQELDKVSIGDIIVSPDKQDELLEAYKKTSDYKYWAIYVLPNEQIDVVYSNSADDFTKELTLFQATQILVGGQIVSS